MKIFLLALLVSVQAHAVSPLRDANPTAPVKLLVAGSIQCPFAKRFMDYIPALRAEFGEQLSIQYIHMPLARQPQAFPAAVASECARAQSQFWTYLTRAFDRQHELGLRTYLSIASELGLDLMIFEKCLEQTAVHERVESERNASQAMGVSGTPSIFINGEFVVGAYPYEHFQELIRAKLEEALR